MDCGGVQIEGNRDDDIELCFAIGPRKSQVEFEEGVGSRFGSQTEWVFNEGIAFEKLGLGELSKCDKGLNVEEVQSIGVTESCSSRF